MQESFCCQQCCKIATSMSVCTKCHLARYCSAECQSADWGKHKLYCKLWRDMRQELHRRELATPSSSQKFQLWGNFLAYVLHVRSQTVMRCMHLVSTTDLCMP
jgi:MYND finger